MAYVGNTYQQIEQAVTNYYGSGSDAWAKIYAGAGGYYSEETARIIQQVPGVTVTRSNSGKILSYSYANTFPSSNNPAAIIDSNVETGTYGGGSFTSSIPSTVVQNEEGNLVAQSGSRSLFTGATVATVVDRLSLAAVGVSLGTKLGKFIDNTIYSINPDWWDIHFPTINPETWDTMAVTDGQRQLIQAIFGLQGNNTTMYIDERMLAYAYQMMSKEGFWSESGQYYPPNSTGNIQIMSLGSLEHCINTALTFSELGVTFWSGFQSKLDDFHSIYGENAIYIVNTYEGTGSYGGWSPLNITAYPYNIGDNVTIGSTPKNGKYLETYGNGGDGKPIRITNARDGNGNLTGHKIQTGIYEYGGRHFISNLNARVVSGAPNGITNDTRAEIQIDPNVITASNLEEVLEQLKENYPQLFEGSIYQDTPQEDGSVNRITYIPVPIPNGITSTMPVTGETSQSDPSVNPNKNSDSLIDEVVQIIGHPETYPHNDVSQLIPTNPPNTGDGNTPIVAPITGSGSTLWKIYNPSQNEIDAFGGWLWSSDFIDQIKKLFSDPMQAIIGIHKIFCTPSIGGVTTIKCGYLDSGISCNFVSEQYTHIDCGTINLPEYFGNVFDYNPYTRISLFLPCVGIVPLDVSEVMRSSINVKLHCDVLTGALLAEISVIRDQAGGVLYTYSGSCIVTYPVSSGSYIGAIANVMSLAAGIIGTVASGGELAPTLAGTAISQLSHTRANVQHSGSFSGAVGVMGGKIPYLIISRPQTRMAEQYQQYDGVPANFTTRLSDCSGYIKVKEVHLKVPNAYETEIVEIEQLLHEGILI